MLQVVAQDFFIYTFNVTSLAAGASALQTVTIQTDSQFKWQKMSMFADIAGAVQTDATRVIPLITMQITDTSSGRLQFNKEIPLGAIAGDGQFPFILPEPKIFLPKATIQISLNNYSAATTYANIFVNLIGTKLFMNDSV